MTEKKHCDVCDQVIDSARTPIATVKLLDGTSIAIEVAATPHPDDAHLPPVHVCLYCALAALNDKDKRPWAAPEIPDDYVKRHHRAELQTLVDRFLRWPVPDTEIADPCASSIEYTRQYPESRTGTNFLSGIGARAMLIDVLELEI